MQILTADSQPDVSARRFTGSRTNHTSISAGIVWIHIGDGKMALTVNSVSYVERKRDSSTRPLD